jgi:hypothetical protein
MPNCANTFFSFFSNSLWDWWIKSHDFIRGLENVNFTGILYLRWFYDYGSVINFSTIKDYYHYLVKKNLPNIEIITIYWQGSKKNLSGLAVQANWGKYSKSA